MIKTDDLNPNLLKAQYAVRGPIVIRALELEKQGKKIIYCNIGNPQALKQKPLTFIRQILSLAEYPELLKNPEIEKFFPSDIIERVKMLLNKNPNGTGAYTQSEGIGFIREAVAKFIEKRDGISANANRIMLTDGASKGVQLVFSLLTKNKTDGYLIPIPQYPLYSATIALYGANQIDYYLDENANWQLNETELNRSINAAKKNGINPVAIAIINPGNPTGGVLSKDNIKMIVNFAKKNNLAIMADEVYQENIYAENSCFHSFAKIIDEMKEKNLPLFSFHSVSKGFLGECGHRGGYLESRNIPDDVYAQMIKLQSIGLCANVPGQLSTYAMVAPPENGDMSYDLYLKEKNAILSDLKEKANILGKGLNNINGMSISIPQGAMYAFVKFELSPEKDENISQMTAREKLAHESERDVKYCMALMEKTGICVVPGSGFGQKPGTFHFRTTFLPPKEDIVKLAKQIKNFHESYVPKLKK